MKTTSGEHDQEAAARVLSRLSHQLRNPLAVIVGYAELIGLRGDEHVRRQAAAEIAAAADLLRYAFDELLVLLALEVDAVAVDPSPVELERAVEATLSELRSVVTSHTFETNAPNRRWPTVAADEEHLARILTNVLMNAVRSSPEGGDVELVVREEEGFAEVAVSDHFGLTRDELEKVFERLAAVESPSERMRGSPGSSCTRPGGSWSSTVGPSPSRANPGLGRR